MLILEQQMPNPQIFTDTSGYHEPELIKEGNEYYIRHFLISETHPNTNSWRTENLDKWVTSAKGYPLIITPGYHHIADPDRKKWFELQKPYAIGDMEQILFNDKFHCYDALTHVTNEKAKSALDKGYMPKFVSPGIHGNKVRLETENGKIIRVFEDAQIMHSAVVLKPSFPKEIAQINDTTCKGEKFLCQRELAAIAEEIDIEKLFSDLNNTNEKNSTEDISKMDTPPTSSHVDVLLDKLQKELAEERKQKELEIEKNKSLAETLRKEQETNQSITKERDDFKTKTTSYEAEKAKAELKKSIEEKLSKTKMFYNNPDARSKKVDELVDKNFKIEDLDVIYENLFMTEDEIKKAESQPEQGTTRQIGIAEQTSHTTLQTRKPNAGNVEGAMILEDILELRL